MSVSPAFISKQGDLEMVDKNMQVNSNSVSEGGDGYTSMPEERNPTVVQVILLVVSHVFSLLNTFLTFGQYIY